MTKISKENKKLIDLMLTKSQDSFLLAIEIYNKPTITLNVEGFVIFICNAWELLLKAYLLKNGESIYYRKSGSSNRTLALDALIKKIMTNNKDNVRANLEIVNGIRNAAIHLLIPKYALMLNELFLSCVKNYVDRLYKYFEININDRINTDFLSLHIPSTKSTVDIMGKYGKQVYQKYYDTSKFVSETLKEKANENGIIPEELAMSYEIRFKKVNDISNADICVYNAKNEKSVRTIKVVETSDPNQTHPLKQSDIIEKVQKEMSFKGISFVPYTISKNTKFTADSFKMFCKFFGIKSNPKFSYFFQVAKRYSYSYELIEYIIQKISDDPELFIKIKEAYKKS